MTATPPPPRDGEVCATCGDTDWQPNGSMCDHDDHPAAPSETPAADSPTPGAETCPGDFQGDSMVIPCGHPKGHPPLQDGSDRYWRHGRGSMHWGRMRDYSPAAPSPVDTTEPQAETQQDIRDEEGNYLGKAGTTSEHRTVGDYRAWCYDCGEWCYPSSPCGEPKCCAEIAARPPADTETLREQVETWIDEAPEQTAGLDLLRQIIGRPR